MRFISSKKMEGDSVKYNDWEKNQEREDWKNERRERWQRKHKDEDRKRKFKDR